MTVSRERIHAVAQQTGFSSTTVEKVVQLMNLLEAIEEHPVLRGRFALKGGTALNLFVFPLPRLSVDIDLNLVESLSREELEAVRPRLEQALGAVFRREGFNIRTSPNEHAGGKWRLGYPSALGGTSTIEVDVNYVLRTPLWEPELAGGKLSALFSRVAFVVYGGFNRVDWRTISIDRIDLHPVDVERMLVPTVQPDIVEASGGPGSWIEKMVAETRERLTGLLPMSRGDQSFLNALLDRGEIRAELLTDDSELQRRIASHPMLNWKAINVRQYRGLT